MQDLCKSYMVRVILFYFILAQGGKILAQFLCKSFILFYCKWASSFSVWISVKLATDADRI